MQPRVVVVEDELLAPQLVGPRPDALQPERRLTSRPAGWPRRSCFCYSKKSSGVCHRLEPSQRPRQSVASFAEYARAPSRARTDAEGRIDQRERVQGQASETDRGAVGVGPDVDAFRPAGQVNAPHAASGSHRVIFAYSRACVHESSSSSGRSPSSTAWSRSKGSMTDPLLDLAKEVEHGVARRPSKGNAAAATRQDRQELTHRTG